jgi:hypothetical protein
MSKPNVYSPSQTDVFLHCPIRWWLRYKGKYQPYYYAHKELAGSVGTAFSTYMEYRFSHDPVRASEEAYANLAKNMAQLQASRICAGMAEQYEASVNSRLQSFIDAFEADPGIIPPTWQLFDAERSFPDHGNCRVDTMFRTAQGALGVMDYKTRGRLNANWVESTKREFRTSNQLMHYAWAASEVYGEPVRRVAILLFAYEPQPVKAYMWHWPVDPQEVENWAAGRKSTWRVMQAMEDGKLTPWPASEHKTKFGPCEYYGACYTHKLNTEQMAHEFVQIQR